MDTFFNIVTPISHFLWGPWTFFVLMGAGILFTFWTRFSQFKALTHGVAVTRGVYDNPDDPGAINHFQALSAALSATVGLGNIGGVALAVAAGGPGAVFWIWIIGFLGMAIKTVEVTLAMIYRNTDDPDNPHGGAMWVIDKTLGAKGGAYKALAKVLGVTFCITLIVSAFTGGNMFQAWNVADLSKIYFGVPKIVTGIVLAVIVGLVIIGGIKRIGNVAGKLVPFMCILYLLAAFAVLAKHIPEIPGLLALIVKSAFSPTEASGAFLGGSLYWAFSVGLRRALFSNEAGQGSAPIAHSAAKTNEPVREGVVSGLEPFIDTICICTLTALVILSTKTWNRAPLVQFSTAPVISEVLSFDDIAINNPHADVKKNMEVFLKVTPRGVDDPSSPSSSTHLKGVIAKGDNDSWVIKWNMYTAATPPRFVTGDVFSKNTTTKQEYVVGNIGQMPPSNRAVDDGGTPQNPADDRPYWGLLTAPQSITITQDQEYDWDNIEKVFIVLEADSNTDTSFNRHQLSGVAHLARQGELTADEQTVTAAVVSAEWSTIVSAQKPNLAEGSGLYQSYQGAALTAYSFDRDYPGLGKYLVTLAAWLFAISTMISWGYYGEQGVLYITGPIGVLPYKILFLGGAIFAAVGINSTARMEVLMDLGTGAMLWANMPIVLMIGYVAVNEMTVYFKKLKAGEFNPYAEQPISDVGKDKDSDA